MVAVSLKKSFFQAEDGILDVAVTGVQTCALPIYYLVKADLPGFAKEDIRIDVDGDCLTISAEKKKETKEEKDNFIRRERRYGSLSRSFDISGVDAAAIKAKYDSGVLELTLPKKGDVTPSSHQISIE